MGVLLSILGLVGRLILWMLGIVLFLLFLLLFYPIKYQVEGEMQDSVRVRGRIHWFWFLFRMKICYDETFQYNIRLCGLDLERLLHRKSDSGRTKKKSKKKPAGMAEAENGEEIQETVQNVSQDIIQERTQNVSQDMPQDTAQNVIHDEQDAGRKKDSVDLQGQTAQDISGKSEWHIFCTIKRWWHKLRHFLSDIKKFFKNLRRKTVHLKEIVSFLREENTKAFVCIMKDNVVHLWRKLKPKVFRGHLLFGTGDPASTGEILGVLAILYIWYGDGIQVVPDFEQKILQGDFFMRGRVSLFSFVWVVIRILFSDEWRHIRKSYDKISLGETLY